MLAGNDCVNEDQVRRARSQQMLPKALQGQCEKNAGPDQRGHGDAELQFYPRSESVVRLVQYAQILRRPSTAQLQVPALISRACSLRTVARKASGRRVAVAVAANV